MELHTKLGDQISVWPLYIWIYIHMASLELIIGQSVTYQKLVKTSKYLLNINAWFCSQNLRPILKHGKMKKMHTWPVQFMSICSWMMSRYDSCSLYLLTQQLMVYCIYMYLFIKFTFNSMYHAYLIYLAIYTCSKVCVVIVHIILIELLFA